jgi:hypothetical protein
MNTPATPGAAAVFRVMLGEDGWTAREDGGEATAHPSRQVALREARRRAQSRPVARVIVHYADGSVERQILFHGEPRSAPTWRAADVVQRAGSRSTE